MKLKFNIQYNTEWGQQMHVVVNYVTSDRREREQNFLMQTQDGTEWALDVVLMESRQTVRSFHSSMSIRWKTVTAACFAESGTR